VLNKGGVWVRIGGNMVSQQVTHLQITCKPSAGALLASHVGYGPCVQYIMLCHCPTIPGGPNNYKETLW